MKIRILSDLHLELAKFQPAAADADVVVLAGDIHTNARGVRWAGKAFPNSMVLYLSGNHEFYGADMAEMRQKMRDKAPPNVRVLENEVLLHGHIRFIAASLWTDFALFADPEWNSEWAGMHMNDYYQIRAHDQLLSPNMTEAMHHESRAFIEAELARPHLGKTIVISHHAPSLHSTPVQHRNKRILAAYASHLDELVAKADVWIHGHVHTACSYKIGNCMVICNPRGYVTKRMVQQTGFVDPCVIEV